MLYNHCWHRLNHHQTSEDTLSWISWPSPFLTVDRDCQSCQYPRDIQQHQRKHIQKNLYFLLIQRSPRNKACSTESLNRLGAARVWLAGSILTKSQAVCKHHPDLVYLVQHVKLIKQSLKYSLSYRSFSFCPWQNGYQPRSSGPGSSATSPWALSTAPR